MGKVLSGIVEASEGQRDGILHVIACLERPEKGHFMERVRAHGGEVMVCPGPRELAHEIADSDIVQLEWWHHPSVAGWLGSGVLPAMRLVVWSHVSGIYVPYIPTGFLAAPMRFLFSSPCSWSRSDLMAFRAMDRRTIDVVFSFGGFDGLPGPPERSLRGAMRVGYLGSLNFAKLHPRFLDYVAAMPASQLPLTLIGDIAAAGPLLEEANRRGLAHRLDLRGYRTDAAAELSALDVLAYLLNPLHYGTAENALLEAMAMGVVPIVLNNQAERHLVRHGETGLVVESPDQFAAALGLLAKRPDELDRLSRKTSCEVRQRFSVHATAEQLRCHYRAVLAEPKREWNFRSVFGARPSDWFRSCLGPEAWRFHDDGSVDIRAQPAEILLEPNKGSVFHYRRFYPDDRRLAAWAEGLTACT